MAARVARGAVRTVAFIRGIPWTVSAGELRQHFAQFGHIRRCNLPFDKDTGFHRGLGWVQFSSEEELNNVLQHDKHVIDGVKLMVLSQRPKALQGGQASDEDKDL
ncbi:SRA stem-loop-interacting RNA-binding protein, mitochondrial [Erinaceus europaeus]|uniref:SRA stem-loop-interacting RNA-binding protein, mitochondrial n=1 Tax=Erinaceus europaeus TaxID=9365 RepID=A0A1S3A8Y1_ERIEU|nr:SRA stem-loop-interacting RNA-binding protein, mitochondrial [Erinaceus europaeus]